MDIKSSYHSEASRLVRGSCAEETSPVEQALGTPSTGTALLHVPISTVDKDARQPAVQPAVYLGHCKRILQADLYWTTLVSILQSSQLMNLLWVLPMDKWHLGNCRTQPARNPYMYNITGILESGGSGNLPHWSSAVHWSLVVSWGLVAYWCLVAQRDLVAVWTGGSKMRISPS